MGGEAALFFKVIRPFSQPVCLVSGYGIGVFVGAKLGTRITFLVRK